MVKSVSLFNQDLGISAILTPLQEQSLPPARPLTSSAMKEAGLEEAFAPLNAQRIIAQALCPRLRDSEILRPDLFLGQLRASLERMRGSKNKAVRRFAREQLGPLLDNHELLRAYVNLALEG